MLTRRAIVVPLLLALGSLAAMGAGPAGPGSSGSVGGTPTQAAGQAVTARTLIAPAGPVALATGATAPVIRFRGLVMLIRANGNFKVSNGVRTYAVVMSPTTRVINLRGREVPRQFIQVANWVTVTGRRTGTTIRATTVLIPTRKDRP